MLALSLIDQLIGLISFMCFSVPEHLVKSITWQTLQAVNFCHKQNVSGGLAALLHVVKSSACFWIPPVSSLLQLPASRLLYDSFSFLFFFNKNSFPLADQQLMYHLDTTNAARPAFNRAAWRAESAVCLFSLCTHTSLISPSTLRTRFHWLFCPCSAFTETSNPKTFSSPNTKSSSSVTLDSPGFSVS